MAFIAKLLKQKGMTVLAEYSELKQPWSVNRRSCQRSFLQQHPDIAEGYLKGEIEGMAFASRQKTNRQ